MSEHLIESFNRKRIAIAVGACLCALSALNYFLSLGLLGQFDGKAFLASVVVQFLLLFIFGPTHEEMQEYKRRFRNNTMRINNE